MSEHGKSSLAKKAAKAEPLVESGADIREDLQAEHDSQIENLKSRVMDLAEEVHQERLKRTDAEVSLVRKEREFSAMRVDYEACRDASNVLRAERDSRVKEVIELRAKLNAVGAGTTNNAIAAIHDMEHLVLEIQHGRISPGALRGFLETLRAKYK